jgi:signal transduction histidine kinase
MEGKPSVPTAEPSKNLEHIIELGVWLVLLALIFGVQLLPMEIIPLEDAYRIAGAIIAFALFYYYIVWKYFRPEERRFVKDLTDILFIGMILIIAKEYSIYFFTLLFLPIAAATFTLNLLHSLLIATTGAVLIAIEIILSGQGLLDESSLLLSGSQIFVFLAITVFVRFIALQVRHERDAKLAAEARVERLAHDLAEQQKLEGMEREFTNLASHQLLTPLSIIRGFASILEEKPQPMTKEQQGFVQEILENSRRMVRLLDNLRLETKVSQGRLILNASRQPLLPLLSDIVDEFRLRAKEAGLRLTFAKPSATTKATFDTDATRQILWNLLDNACHYVKRGGQIQVLVTSQKSVVLISVTDTGQGITPTDQAHIFERFYRGQAAMAANREGTGLGLAIAQELAERQSGHLSFISELGKGSTFTLELPK